MKLNSTRKFSSTSRQVFDAMLDPTILQSCIPGCNHVEYIGTDRIVINITTPLPGLKGPYGAVLQITQAEAPHTLALSLQRKGVGGVINAAGKLQLTDEVDGTLLSYEANAILEGPVAIANNPLGQGIVKNSLNTFFKNLENAIKNRDGAVV
jgi:carbon monoxide dehydrogenase subunit G